MKALKFIISCPPAKAEDIDAFQREFGADFSDDLREFFLVYNGGCLEFEHAYYQVPEKFSDFRREYSDDMSRKSGVVVQDLFGIQPLGNRFSLAGEIARLNLIGEPLNGWMPIAKDGSGNRIIVPSSKSDGLQVAFLDHETGQQFFIASSCAEFYDGLTEQQYLDV